MRRIVFDHERISKWVCARTGGTHDGLGTSIGLEEDGALIAGVMYDNYNGGSICMHVASDGSKRWLTREYLRICFDYPFRQLKVNAILGFVDSTNLAARKMDEHLGFVLQCEIPGAGSAGGLCIYSMTPSECRWLHLKERHGIEKQPA